MSEYDPVSPYSEKGEDGNIHKRYANFAKRLNLTDPVCRDAAVEMRRDASLAVEEFAKIKRDLATNKDYEGARILSNLMAEQQKIVKAVKIILDNYFAEAETKDRVQMKFWPVELYEQLDWIFIKMELALDKKGTI